jgi:hypothetical protein
MSSAGIDRRLTRAAQLLGLCRELAKAKRASVEKQARVREEPGAGLESGESGAQRE